MVAAASSMTLEVLQPVALSLRKTTEASSAKDFGAGLPEGNDADAVVSPDVFKAVTSVSTGSAEPAATAPPGAEPAMLEGSALLEELEHCMFPTEYLRVQLDRQEACIRRAAAAAAAGATLWLPQDVRRVVILTLGRVLTGLGFKLQAVAKAAALLDNFVACAPPKFRNLASLPSLVVRVCKTIVKGDTSARVNADQFMHQAAAFLSQNLLQLGRVESSEAFVACEVRDKDLLTAVSWQIDSPTAMQFFEIDIRRLDVATKGHYTAVLDGILEEGSSYMLNVIAAHSFFDLNPSVLATGVLGAYLSAHKMLSFEALCPAFVPLEKVEQAFKLSTWGARDWLHATQVDASRFPQWFLGAAEVVCGVPCDFFRRCTMQVLINLQAPVPCRTEDV